MGVRVHLNRVVIVAPPSDVAIGLVSSTDEARNGAAAIRLIKAIVARCITGRQQSLAVLLNIILDLSAGHSRRITGRKCNGAGEEPQESPHFENRQISRLFGPHKGRTEGPAVPR